MREPGVGRRGAERAREAQAAFAADYRTFQYRFVEFFVEHLSDVSRAFGGDLQAMMVLAIVGQVHMRAARDAGGDPARVAPERAGIAVSRIADVTGIPRQTVRRKLALLQGRGWIDRNPDGAWRLAVDAGVAAAREDLAEIDARGLERVARLFRDLEGIVAARATSRPDPP